MIPRARDTRRDRIADRSSGRRLGDSALSDVVATIMLVGVTVSLVAGASLGLVYTSDPSMAAPRIALAATAVEGDDAVRLLHTAGETFSGASLRAIVVVDGRTVYDGPLANAPFGLGDSVTLPVGAPLLLGQPISVSLVDVARGRTLSTAEFDVSGSLAAQTANVPTFTMSLSASGGSTTVVLAPPAELLVEADVRHEAGRKFVRHVYVDLSSMKGPAWTALRDDGAGGDRVAGDGLWGALVLVPRDVEGGVKRLHGAAVDFEGHRTSATLDLDLVRRLEATEESLNPTGSPEPDSRSCPAGKAAIQSYRYGVSGSAVADLTGSVREGDRVTAFVTIAPGCSDVTVSLVSYEAPSALFEWETAGAQTIHDAATSVLGPGEHILEIDVPSCHFQVNLVLGAPLLVQGPPSTNNYYSKENRLLDADNGGERSCGPGA